MIINNITFKNIKSYGNKLQSLDFDREGGLVLLTGINGAGKSSIQDSIDLALFNQVRGKETTKIPLKHFPNRLNKDLMVNINFNNNDDDVIDIKRTVQPNTVEITKNGEPYTERFKILTSEEQEKVIGFDYNTFKSFISLSMNDFLNFIKLTPENKRNLLNRLFNLDEIDNYFNTNKELINQHKKRIEKLSIGILTIDNTLKEYKSIISKKVKQGDKLSKGDLKRMIAPKKVEYLKYKADIKIVDDKISDFLIEIQEHRNHINISNNENIRRRVELDNVSEKVKLYNSGVCPYCMSSLTDSNHKNRKSEFIEKMKTIKQKINDNNIIVNNHKQSVLELSTQQNILEDSKTKLNREFTTLKNKLLILKDKLENYNDDDDAVVDELKQKGILLIKNKKDNLEEIKGIRKELAHHDKLKAILSESGIRREFISSLITPINNTLSELLGEFNYPFSVQLNDNFDAIIYDRGEPIYSEILSNGEQRILNICIAISYIKMVREITELNVLFMDEVFQSIHKVNIDIILTILKKFAITNKLNLILVHQGLEDLDPNIFSRIISVEKDVIFSDITDTSKK